jgi:hypothetical protein
MEHGDYGNNQYHSGSDDDYNDNTTWMEGLMEELLDSQNMYQGSEMYGKACLKKGQLTRAAIANGQTTATTRQTMATTRLLYVTISFWF